MENFDAASFTSYWILRIIKVPPSILNYSDLGIPPGNEILQE
jgi:hypothetical protein